MRKTAALMLAVVATLAIAVVAGRAHAAPAKAADTDLREWGLRMLLVSSCLERIGDHAVDIGEQTAFLVSGQFREFTDASH